MLYDSANRLTTLNNSWAGQFGFSYDALNRRIQMARPNGTSTTYNYDSLSRLLGVLHGGGNDGAKYGYDNAGNRTSKQNLLTGMTENYSYDSIYELTRVVQGASTTASYNYDPVGNRLASLSVSPYQYDVSNHLSSVPSATYNYDSNGNLLSKTNSTGTTQYAWDYENRLISAAAPQLDGSTPIIRFQYDPFGRRIQKSSPSRTRYYVYDGANIVAELNTSGGVVASYTQGLGVDEPLAMQRGATVAYYQADALGSLTSLSTGDTYNYDSLGNILSSTGNIVNPYRFTGREYDSETGLYFLRARYYDPQIGRFISEDPLQFGGGGTDFYAYVRNSPINLTDPFGLCPKKTNVQCLESAFASNLVPMIADATGTIPGEGQVLAVAQAITGAAGTLYSIGTTNGETSGREVSNTIGGIISQSFPLVNAGLKQAGLSTKALKILPGTGNVLSGWSFVNDVYKLGSDYYKCLLQNMD